MAGIGDDIKDVLQELGTPFKIHKVDGTVIVGEYLDYGHFYDSSTEFIRQFVYSGDFQYDSKVDYGDIISFDGKFFLVTNVRATLFENSTVDHSNFFVWCNKIGWFGKETKVRDPQTMENTILWQAVHSDVPAVMVEKDRSFDRQETVGQTVMDMALDKFTLYCQGFPDVHAGMRWYPSMSDPGDHYKIVAVSRHRFPNCLTIRLEEESRE
jgi:hypothetical protein